MSSGLFSLLPSRLTILFRLPAFRAFVQRIPQIFDASCLARLNIHASGVWVPQ